MVGQRFLKGKAMSETDNNIQEQRRKTSMLATEIISVLHTGYISVITVMLVFSTFLGSFKYIFASEMCYAIHIVVGIFVATIGLFVVIAQIKKNAYAGFLQMLWWTPQLVKVVIKEFDADLSRYVLYSLYHWPMGISFSVELGWNLTINEMLFVQLNIVAVLGMIVAAITKRRIRKHLKQ